MALAPTSLHGAKSISPPSPPGNAGLRLPARPFALRSSSFFSPSLQLLMPLMCRLPRPLHQNSLCVWLPSRPIFAGIAVCGAPKRRFRPYAPAVTKDANNIDVRKARKEQIKKDEAIGQALPFAIALGAAALAGLYFYINSTS
ncbi:UNVERIFIED_CONTAM: hypothetical protein Sangu_2059300 [Sesamum angustifolium]|uniref:Uncharacterized protein n=1 Tax=Sesamum angustifolium TaxID=2727405 RepID=A0AAW2LMT7_9LAMI